MRQYGYRISDIPVALLVYANLAYLVRPLGPDVGLLILLPVGLLGGLMHQKIAQRRVPLDPSDQ